MIARPAHAPERSDAVEIASRTLDRGIAFLGNNPCPGGQSTTIVARKVTANSLRELDRFLHVLIDELTMASGTVASINERNTANKLGHFQGVSALDADGNRLRALGRSSACLFHCAGIARRADRRGGLYMTAGWRGGDRLRRFELGQDMAPSPADIEDVCGFYAALSRQLMARLVSGPVAGRSALA